MKRDFRITCGIATPLLVAEILFIDNIFAQLIACLFLIGTVGGFVLTFSDEFEAETSDTEIWDDIARVH